MYNVHLTKYNKRDRYIRRPRLSDTRQSAKQQSDNIALPETAPPTVDSFSDLNHFWHEYM